MQSLVTLSKASEVTIFEELPTFSDRQWSTVSSKLHTLTTDKLRIHRVILRGYANRKYVQLSNQYKCRMYQRQ